MVGDITNERHSNQWYGDLTRLWPCGSHLSQGDHAAAGDETRVTRRTDAGETDRVLPATPEHHSRRAVACTADHRQVKKSCHKPTRRGGQESVPARDNSEPGAVDILRSERAETTFQRTWHALRSQCERRLLKWRSMRTASRQNDNVDAHQRTAGRILDHQSTRLVGLAAMDAAINTWWPVKTSESRTVSQHPADLSTCGSTSTWAF